MIMDGTSLSLKIKQELKEKVATKKRKPTLAVFVIGSNMASEIYVNKKVKFGADIGVCVNVVKMPENTTQSSLNNKIKALNKSKKIDGIIVQLPLPKHLNESKAINLISPTKDVDGLTTVNQGKLFCKDAHAIVPCTPLGVLTILNQYNIALQGKLAVVVGRSNLVGKPVAQLLLNNNSTVINCHSKTQNLKEITKLADILICAVGKAKIITAEMVKKDAVVIDVGMNRDENGKLCGDVDFDNVSKVAQYITPVPGGVGPMTVAMLFRNLINNNLK